MKRAGFTTVWLPVALLLPQLMIIAIFFYWPAAWAVQSSFYLQDPFGFGSTFVGVENYTDLMTNIEYAKVARFTLIYTALVTFFSLALALLLAVKADAVIVLDEAILSAPKTKELVGQFAGLGIENALIISGTTVDENFAKAARNIPNVDVLPVAGLNVYDILRRKKLVITKEAAEGIKARFDGAKEAK